MKKKFFSLILCVYGNNTDYKKFLNSLKKQTFKNFEIIIINQNNYPLEIPKGISNPIKIFTSKPGLSISRNLGIKFSNAKYLSFPDDDCEYFPETLFCAWNEIKKRGTDIVSGKTVNKKKQITLLKFPNKSKYFNKLDSIRFMNSISFFIKSKKNIKFDENFGLSGNTMISGEETDYILRYLNKFKAKIFYSPKIQIYHKNLKFNYKIAKNKLKIFYYGKGFKRVMFKHGLYHFYILALLKNLLSLFLSVLFLEKEKSFKLIISLSGKLSK
jgi:glycosyltransferase involved in cell wall biosynthesis